MKKVYLLLLFTIFSASVSAQIVTPSLDAGFPVEMASAAGWRFGSALGVQTSFAKVTGETDEADYHNVDSSVLFAYQPSNIITEFYWASPGTYYSWDSSADTLSKTDNGDGRFSLALRGERNVTVGIGYRIADQDSTSDTVNISLYEGSFSLRMLDGLYLAAGMQRVTEKFDTGDSRKWNRILGGVALQVGDPLTTMFRTEVSYQSSPESTVDDPTISPHRKTSQIQACVELLWDSFLFSYQYQNTTLGAINTETEDQTIAKHRYGIGFKMGSVTMGFYAGGGTRTAGDKELKSELYQGTLSFSFI